MRDSKIVRPEPGGELDSRFRDLVEGSIQGVFIHRQGAILFANQAFAGILGYESVEDIANSIDNVLDLVHPDDRKRLIRYRTDRLAGRPAPSHYEFRALARDGSTVWVENVAHIVEWGDGPAIQSIIVDITERKRAEAALRESEARFRDLVEGSIQGIFVHHDFKPLFANQALADMLGYDSPDEILALPSVMDFIHPDEHKRTTRYKIDRLAGGDAPRRYEMRAVRRDGQEIWLENSSRAVDWDGVRVIQGTVVDITERKRAEQSLRESEARFRDLVEGSIQGVVIHRDFKPLFANHAVAEMLGYDSVESLLEQPSVLAFVHSDDHQRMFRYNEQRPKGGDVPARYKMRAIRRDGTDIWLENVARVVDWGGQPAIQATFVDITESKRAEDSLLRSEQSLKDAQRIAKIGNWDWYIAEGVLRWSDEIYRIFGVEPGAFPATYEAFLGYTHPDDRDAVEAAVDRALAGDAPYAADHRIVLGDGTVKVVHEQGEVFRDQSGNPIRMSGIVQDVTELRRTEEALRNSEASLRNAQRIARIGSWDRDLVSNTLAWSETMFDLLGMDPATDTPSLEALLGRVHPDDRPGLRKTIENALNGTAPYDTDFRVVLPCGGERIIHGQGEVVRNAAGEPVSFSGTAQDVTGLRAAEAEVRRLNAELEERVEQRSRELRAAQAELIKKERLATLGQLTATVSHELRNPLGSIRTSVYVLSQRIDKEDDRAHRAIERVERGVARCDRIIDELLDFTRAGEIDRRPVAFDRWLDELLDDLDLAGSVEIVRDFGGPDADVLIDPDRMRRAVINLVDNAAQAMDGLENPAITISTRVADGLVEMRIADRGPGIPDSILPHIFEPLYSTKNFGVGLGLPTVRIIAEQHRGAIEVERTGPAGSVFRLSFPLGSSGKGGAGSATPEHAKNAPQ